MNGRWKYMFKENYVYVRPSEIAVGAMCMYTKTRVGPKMEKDPKHVQLHERNYV